jgi:hypothetical protein
VNRLPTTAYAKESLLREARSIALLGVSQANPMSNTCSNGSVEVRKRERPEQDTTDELRLPEERLTFPRITAVDKVTGLDRSKASPPLADLAEDEHPGVVQHLTTPDLDRRRRSGRALTVLGRRLLRHRRGVGGGRVRGHSRPRGHVGHRGE